MDDKIDTLLKQSRTYHPSAATTAAAYIQVAPTNHFAQG